MNRRTFFQTAALILSAASVLAEPSPSRKPWNVLLIVADDLRPMLGAYGDRLAHTPNLDRLAARGVVFKNAHCQFPLCSPSRTSLLTGLYPGATKIGSNSLKEHFRDHWPDLVTLPGHFRQHGYFTGFAGKIFHGGAEDARSWDEDGNLRKVPAKGPRPPGRGLNRAPGESYPKWADNDGPRDFPEEFWPAFTRSRQLVQMLREGRDKPFFLALGFKEPHAPLVAPPKYFARYPLEKIALPPSFVLKLADWKERPAPVRSLNPELFSQRELSSPEQARRATQAYYASLSFLDEMTGHVLDALDDLGIADRTIVVFVSDHGFHLGEHGLWSKWTLFEEATRVPLIICAPGIKPGVSPEPVELVDLYPTLSELCGLKPPAHLQGTSLVPALSDPGKPRDRAALTVLSDDKKVEGHSIRTTRHRYTEWSDGTRELYDHQTDPFEQTNLLAGGSSGPEVAAQLRQRLAETRQRVTGGATPSRR